MTDTSSIVWNPLEEALEIVDISPLVPDPSQPVLTYKDGGSNPIARSVWEAGYAPPSPYLPNTTRNLQFNESSFIASPGVPDGETTFITTSDGYTWAHMSNAINALWPFDEADYAGSVPPITNPYAAGNLVVTPPPGVVKVTANFKGQYIKFFADDPATGAPLDRYFVIDVWGNEYVMHASGQETPEAVRAAFDAAVLPAGWRKEIRQLDEDLILEPARGFDGTYHYLVFRDSADNTYHQSGWGTGKNLAAQVEGMPVWGGETDDVLFMSGPSDRTVNGAGGDDDIRTGRGEDLISGDAGDDVVNAGWGHDRVRGGPGDDSLIGAGGDDFLRGDAGADVFGFRKGFGSDTIVDFEAGVDTIALRRDAEGQVDVTTNGRGDVLIVVDGEETFGTIRLFRVTTFDTDDILFV